MVMLLALVSIVIAPKFNASASARSDARRAELAQKAMSAIDELQTESGLSAWVLAGAPDSAKQQLRDVRTHLDQDRRELLDGLSQLPGSERDTYAAKTIEAVNSIDVLRGSVEGNLASAAEVYSQYLDRIDVIFDFVISRTKSGTDPKLVREGTAISEYLLAKDQLARHRGDIVQKLQANTLSVDDFGAIEVYEAREASHTDAFRRAASAQKVEAIDTLEQSAPVAQADDAIDTVKAAAKAGSIPSVSAEAWWTMLSDEFDSMDVIDDANFDEYLSVATDLATTQRNQAIGYLVVGLVAAFGTAFAAVALGRSLVRGLASVADQAQVIAGERLPEVLDTLRNPTPEALAGALPQVQVDSKDEVGALAEAFNTVLRASVETAMDHAQQRARTVTNMLVNLGRRNQSLIDRQLELMDELEATQEDPDTLERLFRIDHLVTRMRRNAENLVVLAGQSQARSWSESVPMSDVLRGAASEVPDMSRIQIDGVGDELELAGPHAVDVSHLIAELVENASAYSSPATKVVVRTEKSPNGLRVWVVDSGVGMDADELAAANERLASPPDIDALTTDRVGFQVVGRLARQLGVSVVLQANPGGGLAACATLPTNLFELAKRGSATRSEEAPAPAASTSASANTSAPRDGSANSPATFRRVEASRADRDSTAANSSAGAGAPPQGARSEAPAAQVAPAEPDRAASPAPSGPPAKPAPAPTTASGLVKRTPGDAFAGNDKAAAADAGSFRRLPVPGEVNDDDARARRFQQISQLQSAVVSAREDADDEKKEA